MQKLKARVSNKIIQRIVKQALGKNERIQRISILRGGLFNSSCKITLNNKKAVVLRVGPPAGKALLGHEKGLLRRETAIAEALWNNGLPVPAVLAKDFTHRLIKRDYILQEYKEGQNWHYQQKRLTKRENSRLYRQLGEMARRIHSVKDTPKGFGFPYPFRRHSLWSRFLEKLLILQNSDLQAYSLLALDKDIRLLELLKAVRPVFDRISEPCLVHGDLWPRNVLIADHGKGFRISALLDCERGLWGDPDFEWVFHCWCMPPSFWKNYEKKQGKNRFRSMRHLFYKGYYLMMASLEEILHFQRKKSHIRLFHMAEKEFRALRRLS